MNWSKGFLLFASACVSVSLATAPCGYPAHAETQMAMAGSFSTASVRFEQNATDGDVEVVFTVTGDEEGLAFLRVLGPDGRVVADFAAPDASTLGMRQLRMESPEPKDIRALKASYPEGTYKFSGRTRGGRELAGTATLSHTLPPLALFLSPRPEATGVATRGAMISWRPPPGIKRILVTLESDDAGTSIEATLPGGATSFAVPEGFLAPGTEYQVGIGTVSAAGNVSFVEATFTTGK